MIVVALWIVIFLSLSGLMAAIDAAVLSVSHPEIEEMLLERRWGASRLKAIRQHLPRVVVVIVILTNTINVLGPVLVSQQAVETLGPRSLGIIMGILTIGSIIFSEIIPKAFGAHHAPLVSRLAAPALLMIEKVLYPIVSVFAWLSRQLIQGTRPIGTEKQIRALVMLGRRGGHIESNEVRLIYRTFLLNDRLAREIMTPAERCVTISSDNTILDAAAEVRRTEYSRYPIHGSSIHEIHGQVRSRDILEAVADGRGHENILAITQPGLIVDASCVLDDLLMTFRDSHVHLAVVQDQQQTVGLVTLEDVLEQLVGEIEDEKDILTLRER